MTSEIDEARFKHHLRVAAKEAIASGMSGEDFLSQAQSAYQAEIERFRQELAAKQELIQRLLDGTKPM